MVQTYLVVEPSILRRQLLISVLQLQVLLLLLQPALLRRASILHQPKSYRLGSGIYFAQLENPGVHSKDSSHGSGI